MNDDEIRKYVREHYAEVATGKKVHQPAAKVEEAGCCAPDTGVTSC
ncbi:MAG TPA: hypothetical protein G4O10_00705 [Dehalococcoidia bacterium]|nr:hypothetical protein [Dehalococcoidia bacterium]